MTVGAEETVTPPPETDAKKLVALLAVPTEEFSAFTTADCVLCVVTTIAVINTDAGETVSVTAERPTLASKAKSMDISSSLLAVKSLTSPTATIVTTTLYCVPTAAGAPGGAAASEGGEEPNGDSGMCDGSEGRGEAVGAPGGAAASEGGEEPNGDSGMCDGSEGGDEAVGAPGGAAASGGGEGEQELCPNARLPIVMAAGM